MGILSWFEKAVNSVDHMHESNKQPEKREIPKQFLAKKEENPKAAIFEYELWIRAVRKAAELEVDGASKKNERLNTTGEKCIIIRYESYGVHFEIVDLGRSAVSFAVRLKDETEVHQSIEIYKFSYKNPNNMLKGPWVDVMPFLYKELTEKIEAQIIQNKKDEEDKENQRQEYFNRKYKLPSVLK
jgi:hypothetical protein